MFKLNCRKRIGRWRQTENKNGSENGPESGPENELENGLENDTENVTENVTENSLEAVRNYWQGHTRKRPEKGNDTSSDIKFL